MVLPQRVRYKWGTRWAGKGRLRWSSSLFHSQPASGIPPHLVGWGEEEEMEEEGWLEFEISNFYKEKAVSWVCVCLF